MWEQRTQCLKSHRGEQPSRSVDGLAPHAPLILDVGSWFAIDVLVRLVSHEPRSIGKRKEGQKGEAGDE